MIRDSHKTIVLLSSQGTSVRCHLSCLAVNATTRTSNDLKLPNIFHGKQREEIKFLPRKGTGASTKPKTESSNTVKFPSMTSEVSPQKVNVVK